MRNRSRSARLDRSVARELFSWQLALLLILILAAAAAAVLDARRDADELTRQKVIAVTNIALFVLMIVLTSLTPG